tara:strand:- start:321 stop:863 length:543 start_codon:yes stop_codon:yes gene_type:complete
LNTCGFVLEIAEHSSFKQYMLDYISKQPDTSLVEFDDDITKTDWQESNDTTREYGVKFVDILQPYLTEVATQLFAEKFIINNMWYQQYAKNSKHQWHYHGQTSWSAVYFLELPHNNLATQILDIPHNKMVYEKTIEEGDLFIFPASLLHRSPENLTNDLKSIISFNLDFDRVNILEGTTG